MTFGERIKELRRKNDLTQEKLADFLCVSYQAVSKWECGISFPDFSLLGPLTKILNVTADELLGLTASEDNKKRRQIEDAYNETFKTGDLDVRLKLTAEAVKEFPGDMKWLNRYAWDIWCIAVTEPNVSIYQEQRDKAIKMFETVIENTEEAEVKCHAIVGIVQCLSDIDKAKAKFYAELYPETEIRPSEKEELLSMCLEGEERVKQNQHILEGIFESLIERLYRDSSYDTAEKLINVMIPDGNYCHYHHSMYNIERRKAENAAANGDYDSAVEYLRNALHSAKEYTSLEFDCPREYTFTAPLFNRLTYDSRKWARTGNDTLIDDFKECLNKPVFDSLRFRDDFKELQNS